MCDGDFYLAMTFFTCSDCGIGQECDDASVPHNCADGTSIQIGGHCYCTVMCDSIGVAVGDSCADGWTCQNVQATNASANHARICVTPAWNVCAEDPAAPPPPPPPTPTPPPPPPPTECLDYAESCSSDSECCSGDCDDDFGSCN